MRIEREPRGGGLWSGDIRRGAETRGEQALDGTLVAVHAMRRAEAALVEALVEVHREVAAALERLHDEGEDVACREADALAATVDEFVAASGESRRLVGLVASGPGGVGCALEALREGRASLSRVLDWSSATGHLGTDVAVGIGEGVMTRGRDGQPRSSPAFRTALRRRVRQAEAADPQAARRKREETLVLRGAWTAPGEDGTAELTVSGETTRVAAAWGRLDAASRRAKAAGDERTLGQLRSDLLLDLLLVGQLPGAVTQGASSQPPVCTSCGVVSADWWPLPVVGDPVLPPARCTVVVGLDVLVAGTGEGEVASLPTKPSAGAPLGWVPGFGHLDPEHVRAVAVREGSVWRRLVADPVSGHALTVSPHEYRPTSSVARFVRARDGLARDPGSGTEADRCEIDHVVPFDDGGTTTPDNLQCLSRRGHARKTKRQWVASVQSDSAIEWTSLLGRTYTTDPFDYREL
ncbi:HNH endonuclease signature motif containing protein [Kytococcus sp. Marseille-QA3725]